MRLRVTRGRRWVGLALALVGALVLVGSDPAGSPHARAGLALLALGIGGERSLRGLVAAIAAGALVLGGVAWLAADVVAGSLAPGLAAGLGIAVGGGLGSVVWLLAVGEDEEDDTEEMTVDMQATEGRPSPEPADLFEANPDPILYYGSEPELTVRAANPAFGEVFGTSPDDLEGQPLEAALGVEAEREAILEAARAGRPADETVPCETAAGREPLRVRIAPTGTGDLAAGYVIYGPAGEGD